MMIRNLLFRFSLLLIGVLLVQGCFEDNTEMSTKVVGTVYDELTGQALRDCEVTVSPSHPSVKTKSDGTFEISGLKAGLHTLNFHKAGYEEKSVQQTLIYGLYKRLEVGLRGLEIYAITEEKLDFGDLETEKHFYLVNNSGERCEYAITQVPRWASIPQPSGVIPSGTSTLIKVNLHRNAVDLGHYEEVLSIALKGQETKTFTLVLSMEKVEKTAPLVTVEKSPVKKDMHSITIKGHLTATGGLPVTSHGHCWSTTEQPTLQQHFCNLGARESVGEFVSVLQHLAPNTTYYIRSYAANAKGIAYSEQIEVTTDSELIDRWDGSTAQAFSGGSGVVGDPYLITTGAQLNLVRASKYGNAHFKLMNPINLDEIPWQPIENFSGELDGGNFTISNLSVKEDNYGMGLFGQVTGNIRNLHIEGVKIISPERRNIGALAGSIWVEASLENCSVTLTADSKIQGKEHVGGLVGNQNDQSHIQHCQVIGTTTAPQIIGAQEVGGLVGYGDSRNNAPMKISNCQVNCAISGNHYVGGVMGYLRNPNTKFHIENSAFTGQLACQEYGGGIIGAAYYGEISIAGCKVDAMLQGKNMGGMASLRDNGDAHLDIYGSYFKGMLKGTGYSGLLIAQDPSSFIYTSSNCYGCYSAPQVGSTYAYVLSGGTHEDCATTATHTGYSVLGYNSVDQCRDIVRHLKDIHPSYRKYWDFSHSWVSEAVIEGEQVKVNCPKLLWE